MILIVDDDRSVTASLSLLLKQAGHVSAAAGSPDEALDFLKKQPCQLVIQDMNFSRRTSGEEGLELLRRIQARRAVHAGDPDHRVGIDRARRRGNEGRRVGLRHQALDEPADAADHRDRARPGRFPRSPGRAGANREELDARYDFGNLVGNDPRLLRVLQLAGRVAPTDASVLITGESGTGKELIAEAVHRNSRRANRPFVKVNLGGISTSLFESEMFGHTRGAFTDARTDRRGRFEVADGGTIFLDEIGDLDATSQVKMLRVLQDRTFEVLGSSQRREVDVRVISATNRNLSDMVSRGEFREDLLYRINLIPIHLPALRERPEDIPILGTHFLQTIGQVYRREPLSLSRGACRWLQAQPWPGNVRQLRQSIERAVLVSARDVLEIEDFRQTADLEQTEAAQKGAAADTLPPVGSMTMDEIERAMIVKSLRHHGGNISKVAESLGLSRAALYRRFEKYEIPV